VAHVHGTLLWFPDHWGVTAHQDKPCFTELIDSVPGHQEFREWPNLSNIQYFQTRLAQYIEKRALQSCERIFVDSFQVQTELNCLYDTPSKVVPPGISSEWLERYHDVPDRQLTNADYTILSVSRLDHRKRLELLVRAFKKVRNTRTDIELVIAGTGKLEKKLKSLVRSLDIEDTVHFPGYVSEDKLPSYYKSADVFACPGWMSYGITPLEAYGMRTPVAVSTDAFVKEIVGHLDGSRVFTPDADVWAQGIIDLLEEDFGQFDIERIPTWSQYCEEKFSNIISL
jgi:glycosyltransferase involved in cell wall biosynthesis